MGIIRAGDLNRRVTIQRKVADENFESSGEEAWQPIATLWANVQDVLPSRGEQVSDGLSIANRPARIRIRYRSDITSDMRIIYGTRVMQIVAGPAELGRREGLELMAEDYSTSGGSA